MELHLVTESPIEDLFLAAIQPRISSAVTLAGQESVETPWGRFRPDFILTASGRRIAIECDGKEFHNEARDEYRDALILGSGCVDEIYRFRGQDIVHHREDCLYLLWLHHPEIFSERGGHAVERLASDGARFCLQPKWGKIDSSQIMIEYETTGPGQLFLKAFRRGHRPDNWLSEFFEFAGRHVDRDLDGVIEAWRNRPQAAAFDLAWNQASKLAASSPLNWL